MLEKAKSKAAGKCFHVDQRAPNSFAFLVFQINLVPRTICRLTGAFTISRNGCNVCLKGIGRGWLEGEGILDIGTAGAQRQDYVCG